MARLNGNAMLIASGGLPIAASTSCTVSVSGEDIDVAGETQGKLDEAVAGLKQWSVSVDTYYLLTRGRVMAQELMDASRLELTIMIGTKKLYGYAYVKSYEVSGNVKSKVTCRLELQGTGKLTTTQFFDHAIAFGQTYGNYKVAGHEMILADEYGQIALLTDTSLTLQRDMMELQPTDDWWRQFIPRRWSWEISADGLIDSQQQDTGVRSLGVGDSVDVVMRIGLDKYSGKVLVTSMKTDGPLKEKAKVSVSARGCSEIDVVTPESGYFDYEFGFVF